MRLAFSMAPVMCFIYMFLLSCFIDGKLEGNGAYCFTVGCEIEAQSGRMPESCACTVKSFEWDKKK